LCRFLEPFSIEWHKSGANEDQLIAALKGQDPGAAQERRDKIQAGLIFVSRSETAPLPVEL